MKNKDITIKLHPAGAVVLAAAVLLFDTREVIATTVALMMHEGAHLLAMRLCGIKKCTIELTPFGGMADIPAVVACPAWKQMLCASAGVIESALMALMCLWFAPRTVFWHAFFDAHLSLALINILPLWPLDGARVIAAIASFFGAERSIKKFLTCMTVVMGVCFVAVGLYGIGQGVFNPSLLVAGPYLCYAASAEKLATKVRCLGQKGSKLAGRSIFPVKLWAGSEVESNRDVFGVLLGRMEQGQYCLFAQIEDGRITKLWTEDEMLESVFGHDRNRQAENVDKE